MKSAIFGLFGLALFLGAAPLAHPQTSTQRADEMHVAPIRPSATDSEIKEFDDPHWVYVHRGIVLRHDLQLAADRHQLLLWLPGTKPPDAPEPPPGKVSRGASHEFCQLAATLGYHVIALSYPNSIPAATCNEETDPKAFEDFRTAIISGGTTKQISISATNCIEHRLIKLLQLLAQRYPREEWQHFLDASGAIKWDTIAVAGQSQGGGHAALIGIDHRVARVICFGAPKDWSIALKAPAAWYGKDSATPKELFFAFNHHQDHQGCSPEHQLANLRALGLEKVGPIVEVDGAQPPYQNAHILMTNYPGTKVDSGTAHGTMISPKNEAVFGAVWRYLLGG